MSADQARIHATCVLLDDAGVLVRGASGSGKSTFARALLAAANHRGWFARLVSDDRTELRARNGRLIARPVEAIRGMMEIRGVGIVSVPVQGAAVLRLVVDLVEQAPRLPEETEMETEILSVRLPRLVRARGEDIAEYVLDHLCGLARPASLMQADFKGSPRG